MSKRRVLVAVDYDGDVIPEVMDLTPEETYEVSKRLDVYFVTAISDTIEPSLQLYREHPLHALGVWNNIPTHTLTLDELREKSEDDL